MEATAVLYKVVVDEGLVGEEAGEGMLDQVGTSREVADVGHGLPGPRYTLNMHSICTQYALNMYTMCTQHTVK